MSPFFVYSSPGRQSTLLCALLMCFLFCRIWSLDGSRMYLWLDPIWTGSAMMDWLHSLYKLETIFEDFEPCQIIIILHCYANILRTIHALMMKVGCLLDALGYHTVYPWIALQKKISSSRYLNQNFSSIGYSHYPALVVWSSQIKDLCRLLPNVLCAPGTDMNDPKW